MTLLQMLLYVCSLWLYAAVCGSDFVIAIGSRQQIKPDAYASSALPTAAVFASIDQSLSMMRIVAIFSVACFGLAKLPLSSATWLAFGAVAFLALRRAIPNASETSGRRGIPVQSVRAVISAIGLFYVIAAGVVR